VHSERRTTRPTGITIIEGTLASGRLVYGRLYCCGPENRSIASPSYWPPVSFTTSLSPTVLVAVHLASIRHLKTSSSAERFIGQQAALRRSRTCLQTRGLPVDGFNDHIHAGPAIRSRPRRSSLLLAEYGVLCVQRINVSQPYAAGSERLRFTPGPSAQRKPR